MLPSPKTEASFHLAPLCILYTWKLDCGQSTWDKIEVLLRTSWGNTLQTLWEPDGNTSPRIFGVPNVFSLCSLDVFQDPKLFSKAFPVAPQFYPIWFARSFNSHVYKLRRRTTGEYICFYFVTGGPNTCFHWGVLSVPKKLLMGQ
jgi:hypothetical protein